VRNWATILTFSEMAGEGMSAIDEAAGLKWVAVYRRRWFVVVLLLTFSFAALIPLLSGKIYRRQPGEGLWVPIKTSSKAIYVVLSFWLTGAIAYHYMGEGQPYGSADVTQRPAVPQQQAATNPMPSPVPAAVTCTASPIRKETRYGVARAAIVASGFQPSPPTQVSDGSFCSDTGKQACQKFPETEDCSADGKCRMNFVDRSGDKLSVVIFGDGPDDPASSVVSSDCKAIAAPQNSPANDSNSTDTAQIANMKAAVGGNGAMLSVTGDDDQPFTIQRIVFNGRPNEKGCDLPDSPVDPSQMANTAEGELQALAGSKLPVSLKRGDTAAFFSVCGSAILSADIYTDRGAAHFTFE
jgi:hypothetical protein